MAVNDTCLDRLNRIIDGNNHLGHIILECFKTRNPDDIYQIDAATGEKETYASVLTRSVAMARGMREAGFQPGDMLALGGRNHLNLRIPYYAALMNGLPVAGIDPYYKYEETKKSLGIVKPKIAFCESENYNIYSQVIEELGLDTKIFTFSDGESSMKKLIEKFDGKETGDFRPSFINTDKVYAFLISTSGTTGGVKFAAFKHGAAAATVKSLMTIAEPNKRAQKKGQMMLVNLSPVHWVGSFYMNITFPLVNVCILQVPNMSVSDLIDMINKYKPSILPASPTLISLILKNEKFCDFSCFDVVLIGSDKVYKELLLKLKSRIREDAQLTEGYGQTETMPGLLSATTNDPLGSCGPGRDLHEFKLIDVNTSTEITEPYKHGELWVRGPSRFTEYYDNPEDTAKALTEDGWFKTGDILYRDEHGNFYFVERLKMLIKYRIAHVIPTEIEELLEMHPGVLEACVTSIPHEEDGERPVACVVRRPGCEVTAQEIKDLIADKLSDSKQLRGGVVFMESLPKTSNGKVFRAKIRELVRTMKRE